MKIRHIVVAIMALSALVGPSLPSSAALTPRDGVVSTITNFDGAGHQIVRFDVDGNAIDAHDAGIELFGSTYYLYGTSYDCGFVQYRAGPFCGFKSYSSTDLVHWTDNGPLFDPRTSDWQARCSSSSSYGCYRPHVIYDARTNRYVLWFNAYDVGVGYHVFESTQPTGPFTERAVPHLAVNNDAAPRGVNNGDENLFVDDNGTAYLVYTDWHRQGDIVVEQLDANDETGTGRFSRLGLSHTEAPSMFKRQGRYYVVMSDPNCAWCNGTGTAYLTAPTPLGPWAGAGPNPPDYWQIDNGALSINGGDVGLSVSGGTWTDYRFAFDAMPLQSAGGGSYAQAGWVFRARDQSSPWGQAIDGYQWSLSNDPSLSTTGGSLVKTVIHNGQPVSQTTALPIAIQAGQWYHVETDVIGQVITTTVNGQVVDVTQDPTYTQGRIGFWESTSRGESARFGNVRVIAVDDAVLLTDTFSGDLSQFDPPHRLRTANTVSADSCGGQPTNITTIPVAGTSDPLYLFQSDLWRDGATPALANYYWGALSFGADGSIQPLTCTASFPVNLAIGQPGTTHAPADLDQTSGVDGFQTWCGISGPNERLQTFTPSRTGILSSLSLTTFLQGARDTPLVLDVASVDEQGKPSFPLASVTIPPDAVGSSPRNVTVQPNIQVTAGRRYGVVAHSAAVYSCYGFAYNDLNPYGPGQELYSTDGGSIFRSEPDRDLKFSVSVTQTTSLPTSTPLPTYTPAAITSPVPSDTPLPTTTPQPSNTPVLTSAVLPTTSPSPTSVPPRAAPITAAAAPTIAPIHAPTATSTSAAKHIPVHPVATARPNPRRRATRPAAAQRLGLAVSVVFRDVGASRQLTIAVYTAPRARILVTLQVLSATVLRSGAGRKRTQRHDIILYKAIGRGVADARGRFTFRSRLTRRPTRAMEARVTVTARTPRGAVTRTVRMMISPGHARR